MWMVPPMRNTGTSRSRKSWRTRRRLRWRCFGHGSGKNILAAANERTGIRPMKSMTSPSTTRTLRSPRASTASSTAATPGVCTSMPMTFSSGANFGDFDQRLAATETDVEDDVDRLAIGGSEERVERQRRTLDGDSPPLHRPSIRVDPRRRKPAAARLERALWRMRHRGWDRHGTMMVTARKRARLRTWRGWSPKDECWPPASRYRSVGRRAEGFSVVTGSRARWC